VLGSVTPFRDCGRVKNVDPDRAAMYSRRTLRRLLLVISASAFFVWTI